jgi:hypothetical protein
LAQVAPHDLDHDTADQRGSSRKVVGKVSERTISCAWLLR